ncbi:SRPBCC family protein [Vibrio crassostreae]|uniref:SRPBCC family protein n=1 Tax=Vibrio crassostreae TaxID=246167 RepID=UPI000F49FF3A|nr:SRPBCC family protein [Vibrio crassostreae]ROS63355.1 ribosome-associated toxin RatA of RatAB toxin-antitoxin module [Vibrio crassostreae]RPF13266.1 ribosome-associated toxin RatA of RatAB toxin-antitoxin module [Vibrio crassostreae]TCT37188.1 ribosome-associated toxin RatA of RatAB toxin-antitoxin module [Vibrio crassostreae]TCV58266.1 ribosome-associated toxin RatA of RatAB toxin-antitoxin module [Vibrio crassostreae]CAK2571097.1 ribosome association toxin RatA [Vibrio crassostreae]
MPKVTRSALVSFSADQMFSLVNDVARYHEFLPGCSGSRVIESSDSIMVASVDVSKAGISKTFTTSNRLADGAEILMELVDGPFKKLQGGWYFTPLDEQACKVELKLEFEFSSRMIEMAFGKIFNELTSNMVSAFTQRAKQVY